MPQPPKNLIHEISTTTGTGDLTTTEVNGKVRFSDSTYGFGTGGTTNVFWYFVTNRAAVEWEYGTGHMSAAGTMVRDAVIKSSNSDAKVSFSAGTKDVINDLPAPTIAQQLLTSGTVAAAATLDIVLTAYTSYRAIKIVLTNFLPATDTVELWMRTSTDGGSSYNAGASEYMHASAQVYADATTLYPLGQSSGDTKIVLSEAISNVAGEGGVCGEVKIYGQSKTSGYVWASFDLVNVESGSATELMRAFGGGARLASADVDAVRFLFSSGNITSGDYAVYGLL